MDIRQTAVRASMISALLLSPALHATTFKTLYSIAGSGDGSQPQAAVINVGGKFYGTTLSDGAYGNGTVYQFDPKTGSETTLYSFLGGNDGSAPYAALLNVNGTLYGTTSAGGAAGLGTVFKIDIATGAETVVYAFKAGGDAAHPISELIELNGTLYGTTPTGGTAGQGTVYSIDPTTGAETVIYSFVQATGYSPAAALLNVNGTLYGTAQLGGGGPNLGASKGVIFSLNPTTGAETELYAFDGYSNFNSPATALINVNGILYGATNAGDFGGSLYAFNPATLAVTELYVFGFNEAPSAALTGLDGYLWGVTEVGIFKFDLASNTYISVYNFPGGQYTEGYGSALLVDGSKLYAATTFSGMYDSGTLTAVTAKTGATTVAYSFTGPRVLLYYERSGITKLNGKLLVATGSSGSKSNGSVAKLDPATGITKPLYTFTGGADGANPQAARLLFKGNLYGATYSGGAAGNGTIFRMNPYTGATTVLHTFAGPPGDGANPAASLIELNGSLFGTTYFGGSSGYGTVFTIDPVTGVETVLYSFQSGTDGANPNAGLTNVAGTLYGSTANGGAFNQQGEPLNNGILFAINPVTGAETILYVLTSNRDGGNPEGTLINIGGMLFGETSGGRGTVFRFNLATGDFKTLHRFTGNALESDPDNGLVADAAGTLFGTQRYGGVGGFGTVFKLNATTGRVTDLYSFTGGSGGSYPTSRLTVLNHTLYGTTGNGGTANLGTVFSLLP